MSRTRERRARRAAQRKQQQTSLLQNRNLWIYGGVALAVVIMAIAGFSLFNQPNNPSTATPGAGTPSAPGTLPTLPPSTIGVEVAVPAMGTQHIQVGQQHAPYNSTPPTSGPHYDTPAPWGKPSTPVAEETWIHNLEHGGIVALYNCADGCPDLVGKLETLLKIGVPSRYGYAKLLVLPYNKIPNKLTMVAWQYYLPLNDYDDALVRKFIRDHQDKGPEDAP